MNLCTGIEVNDAFLVAFAKYDTFTLCEVDVFSIEFYQFAYTHTC